MASADSHGSDTIPPHSLNPVYAGMTESNICDDEDIGDGFGEVIRGGFDLVRWPE